MVCPWTCRRGSTRFILNVPHMVIRSCDIKAFGCLEDQAFADLDYPVIVVRGPNEAGKSTFFHFLQTMLYGIYPTNEAKHPYAPRGGKRIGGSLTMAAADGESLNVSRQLLSSPGGSLGRADGSSLDLRNQTVPMISHVSRDVFEAVYALSLYDLTALSDESAWQGIQDRLLGSLSINYIRPARGTINEIESEASSLWRPDRKGKPASSEIRKRLAELHKESGAARERDAKARALSDKLAEDEETLTELRKERIRLAAEKRRIGRLAPLRIRLLRIEEAKSIAGDVDEISDFPDDPTARLHDLRSRRASIEDQMDRLDAELEEANRVRDAVTEADRFLLERAAEIGSWSKRISTLRHRQDIHSEAERSLVEAEATLRERTTALLSDAWNEDVGEALRRVSPTELRARVDAFADAERKFEERRVLEDARRESLGTRQPQVVGIVLSLILALTTVVLAIRGLVSFAAICGLLALAAGWWAYKVRLQNAAIERLESSPMSSNLREATRARSRAVAEMLDGVPVPSNRLDRPDPYLANDVQALKQAAERVAALNEKCERLQQEIDGESAALHAFVGHFEVAETSIDNPELLVSNLEASLADAQKRNGAAEAAAKDLPRLELRRKELDGERIDLRNGIAEIEGRLSKLGDGNVERGVDVLGVRKDALQRSRSYEEDLRKDVQDVDDVVREIRELENEDAEWQLSDDEILRLEERLDQVEREVNDLTASVAAGKSELEHLTADRSLDSLESEKEHLEHELRSLGERRDRLMLLAEAIKLADFRFREEHQPDVLRRAGAYLHLITNGRYDRLDYEEGTDSLRVHDVQEGRGHAVEAPLSRGTRDQIYLAVRLAIVDHLDEGHERLPIFLDEVFVNWDMDRRARCYEIFQEVSKTRQVFIFTCHPWLAGELEECLPAKIIDLKPQSTMVLPSNDHSTERSSSWLQGSRTD